MVEADKYDVFISYPNSHSVFFVCARASLEWYYTTYGAVSKCYLQECGLPQSEGGPLLLFSGYPNRVGESVS
jgi:hypothetical protein